jgi:endonuclease/exonuclease/phosphatase (EEP) superfamily protein YafD
MQLLTWNLNGLDDHHLDDRTEAAVFLAVAGVTLTQLTAGVPATPAPDVIVFQEVVARTFLAHIAPHFRRAGFTLYPETPPDRQVFEVVAVNDSHSIVRANTTPLQHSVYSRQLHTVDILPAESAHEISILTAHFDSGAEQSKNRLAQARQVMAMMGRRAIFAGDTNMRASEWDALRHTTMVIDAWEAIGEPAALRRTWRSGQKGARFDRVWIGDALATRAVQGVGIDDLHSIGAPPSDHIGLLVTFESA